MRWGLFNLIGRLCPKALVAATVLLCGAVDAAVVSAGSNVVNAGDTFAIPIGISGAGDVSSWQFDLSFDPALLQANVVTEGPLLSVNGTRLTLFIPGVIDNTAGVVSLVTGSYLDFDPYPSGGGVLAEIEFTALADGLSPLTLSNVFVNFSDAGFDIANGAVCVGGASLTNCGDGTAPEPATVLLLTAALLALAWARRTRGSLCPPLTG